MKKEIGKNTLGGGHKMSVDMKTYNRSTHDLSYIWRNTQSAGTLVPFMKSVALPGDIRDIDLDAKVLTHPTVGPLYGSYKLQLDIFTCPIRLYISALHNNSIKVGMNMSKVKLPKLAVNMQGDWAKAYEEWGQINPSSLLSYLGINGFGIYTGSSGVTTKFNGVPLLAYWDIFKNYYANKQEDNAYFVGSDVAQFFSMTGNTADGTTKVTVSLPNTRNADCIPIYSQAQQIAYMDFAFSSTTPLNQISSKVKVKTKAQPSTEITMEQWADNVRSQLQGKSWAISGNRITFVGVTMPSLPDPTLTGFTPIEMVYTGTERGVTVAEFPLSNIDDMREDILQKPFYQEFIINQQTAAPYGSILTTGDKPNSSYPQYGLALKTYQSDLFNNWINTEWIDGSGGINELTAVSTEGGSFTIDALNIAQKVYNMLNRIALSDGTYRSWLETVWTNEYVSRCESPVYEGGMSQEIVFDEVVSTAGSTAQGDEPLGSLAGRGVLMNNRKGGSIRVKIDEPSYIIGIVSITPRLDYSQGNDFDIDLDNMDDWHKPELDAIGFQDLPASWAAWSERKVDDDGKVTQRSFGKQPAWIEYMTNFNRTKGNFAINNSEAFMVLNRNYTIEANGEIKDATTYIDPVKYNYIFADASLDAMNFWVQIGIKDIARRKMSAKIIPNL